MYTTFPKEWTVHEQRQWLIQSAANSESRLKRLQDLEAPEEIIEGERNLLRRRQEDLEEISKE